MNKKLSNRFLINYVFMFIISTMIAVFAFLLMDFANDVISKTLLKNNYTAQSLMQEDYTKIDSAQVVENGGGLQVINSSYEVVVSSGINTFTKNKLTVEEFTDFLMSSKSVGNPYNYSIQYNPQGEFWLVVTFPTSIRIDFGIAYNKDYISADMQNVAGAIVAIVLFYLLLLAASTVIYSKLTSIGISNPLRKLTSSAKRLRDGDYSARVNLNLKNEFGELQDTFNAMAGQIEQEISLRKQLEENRKKLVLDISHDLKNPLASIMGYAEICRNKPDLSMEERESYTSIIYENSVRANKLITDMFELSKMESTEYTLNQTKVDICEYAREEIGLFLPVFDHAGFAYDFLIPEDEIWCMLDTGQLNRMFQNLFSNILQYNAKGTKIVFEMFEEHDTVVMILKDNGIGIPAEIAKDIFQPFVRADRARNSKTGGTGLGLAIAKKIILMHGGSIELITDTNCGCEFHIKIPKI